MRNFIFLFAFLAFFSCKESTSTENSNTKKYQTEDTLGLSVISTKDFRDFKILDSKNVTKAEIWETINSQMEDFKEADCNRLKSLILEQDIPTLQKHIEEKKLSYEKLTKFYLFRIRQFDRENSLSLNSVISINPNVIEQAIEADNTEFEQGMHPIFGMPILLKDNVNASGMPTTAGAIALKDNNTEDAFIVSKLKSKGALILGKSNLSEWAYFFCGDCPSGYSAIGGQTLNPYGRRIIDTGGSSSGSGVAVSANFCVAAIGSETSGSILSPSSQNSVVGLKPTIGLVSRSGIIPISSTLDTAGPMTKCVLDNAILLNAILGYDKKDSKSKKTNEIYTSSIINLKNSSIVGKRFGVVKTLLEDALFFQAISDLKSKGAIIVEIEEEQVDLSDFLRLLNLDMKTDLPAYFKYYADTSVSLKSVQDVIDFNKKDSLNTMPYGQKLFEDLVIDNATNEEFQNIKHKLKRNGRQYFDVPFRTYNLNGFLSINNYHAGFAAVAEYPAITVPMGYTENGVPKGLTFIGKPLEEMNLLQWAYVFEQASKRRVSPKKYN